MTNSGEQQASNETGTNETVSDFVSPGDSVYDDMSRIEELCERYVEQFRQGIAPPVEKFAAQYPALRPMIMEILPTILVMEKVRGQNLGKRKDGRVESDPNQTPDLGDFQIVREIGRGGMGIVYEAHQISLDRRVAIKVLPSHLLNDKQLAQFQREASTAAKLHHTNIAPVYGVSVKDKTHYFAMQLLEGRTLDDLLKDGKKFSHKEVVAIGQQVVSALQYAHDQGIYHRDIKPSNLILDKNENVWVTDFGLAISRESMASEGGKKMSGTLRYMPPESLPGSEEFKAQIGIVTKPEAVGDIYALGITIIELLTGKSAFDTSSPANLTTAIRNGEIQLFEHPDKSVPNDLVEVLKKAVNIDPSERYQFARELGTDLQNISEGRSVSAVPFSIVGNVWRWSKRNSALASVSLIAAFLLYAVSMLSSISYYQIDRSLKSEQQQRQRAENASRVASQSIDKIFNQFAHLSTFSDNQLGTDAPRPRITQETAAMLKELAGFYGRLASDNRDEVEIQVKSILSRAHVAEIHERLGEYDLAVEAFRKTLRSYERLVSQEKLKDSVRTRVAIARIRNQLGTTLKVSGDPESGNEEHKAAIASLNEALQSFGSNEPRLLFTLAHSHFLLGRNTRPGMGPNSLPPPVHYEGDPPPLLLTAESTKSLETALEYLEKLNELSQSGIEAESQESIMFLTSLCNRELAQDVWSKRTEQDDVRHLNAVAYLKQLSQSFPNNLTYRYELTKTLAEMNVFENGMDEEELMMAYDSLQQATDFGRQLVAEQPDVTGFQIELIHAYFKLGNIAFKLAARHTDNPELQEKFLLEQEDNFRKALNAQTYVSRQRPDVLGYKAWTARFALSLADCQTMQKKKRVQSRLVGRALDILFALPDELKSKREIADLIEEARSLSTKTMIGNDNQADPAEK